MKQAIVLATFIVAVISCFAKSDVSSSGHSKSYKDSTSYSLNASEMDQMLADIISVAGLQTNFEVKQANVLNMEAAISHRKKYILYNQDYITSLAKITRSKWAVMALLAHEIGHHYNEHTKRRGGSKPGLELEADEFAGFVLQKLGATLQQSQQVMHFIAKTKESSTHPARSSRLLAIEKGWNKAVAESQAAVLN